MLTDSESQTRQAVGAIPLRMVSQGAEAIIYETQTHPYLTESQPPSWYMVKCRPHKPYRHEFLDKQLTKHRTLAEARLLHKLRALGVSVPELVFVDPRNGVIWMSKVRGRAIKQWIWDLELELEKGGEVGENELEIEDQERAQKTKEIHPLIRPVLERVGAEIGRLHANEIVHGDLTTSNVMLDEAGSGKAVLIDFGLASVSSLVEDKAVDLYVLERAVDSTHPVHAEKYKQWLLDGYTQSYEPRQAKKLKELMAKLEQVRLRGRKRSMVG